MNQSWCIRYKPQSIDECSGNTHVKQRLKAMIQTKLWTHMIFRGPPGCGKRSLVSAFLNDAQIPTSNILRIFHSNTKLNDIKTYLSSFLEKKTSQKHKWIIIQNISRFPIQFHYTLYNIFTMTNITVIIVETKENIPINHWCILFSLQPRIKKDFIDIVRRIEKSQNIQISQKKITQAYVTSQGNLYAFLHILQWNPGKWYSSDKIPCELILFDEKIEKRLESLNYLIDKGYSCLDLVILLYEHLKNNNNSTINDIIIMGRIRETYNLEKEDLFYAIQEIWKNQRL